MGSVCDEGNTQCAVGMYSFWLHFGHCKISFGHLARFHFESNFVHSNCFAEIDVFIGECHTRKDHLETRDKAAYVMPVNTWSEDRKKSTQKKSTIPNHSGAGKDISSMLSSESSSKKAALASSSFSRLSRNSFACWSRAVCFAATAFFARFAVGSATTLLCARGGTGEDGADFGARFASRSLPADSGWGGWGGGLCYSPGL